LCSAKVLSQEDSKFVDPVLLGVNKKCSFLHFKRINLAIYVARGAHCALVLENRVSPNIGSIQKNVIKKLKTFSSTIGSNKAIDVI
jgi:hypothetical protein